MHTLRYSLAALLAVQAAHAASLGFVNGDVDDAHTLRSTISGPTNQWIYVERLKYDTQVWQIVSLNWIDASGYCSFTKTNALDGNFYGIYRARTTNYAYLSTNAFGAVAGNLPRGTSLIGNPFANPATNAFASQILRSPIDSVEVFAYRAGAFTSIANCSSDTWLTDGALIPLEGVAVVNSGTNQVHFVVSGLVGTNAFSRTLVAGANLLVSPAYRLLAPNTNAVARTNPQEYQPVDLLTAGLLGGLANLPVPTPWSTNQTGLSRLTSHTGTNLYTNFRLSQYGTNWLNGSNTPVSIPLNLAEGFWLTLPTNRIWSVPGPSVYP